MSSMLRLASLLFGLALLSPALCLPRPDHQYDAPRSLHSARAPPPFKMPGWEIAVIILGLIVGVILFGLIGGACETLICMQFKRPVRADPPGANPDGLEFGCQGSPGGGMPEIRIMSEKDAGDQVTVHHVGGGSTLGRSVSSSSGSSSNVGFSNSSVGSSRYSWQDEKGITTEMYLDGTLPGAGPGAKTNVAVSDIQQQGYLVQGAMRGYDGLHYQAPVAGLASNPPFVLHNEEDDSDYEDEHADISSPSQHSKIQPAGFAVAESTDDVVSPLTPGEDSAAWPQPAVSTVQATRYFGDVDLDDGHAHDNGYRYDR